MQKESEILRSSTQELFQLTKPTSLVFKRFGANEFSKRVIQLNNAIDKKKITTTHHLTVGNYTKMDLNTASLRTIMRQQLAEGMTAQQILDYCEQQLKEVLITTPKQITLTESIEEIESSLD